MWNNLRGNVLVFSPVLLRALGKTSGAPSCQVRHRENKFKQQIWNHPQVQKQILYIPGDVN